MEASALANIGNIYADLGEARTALEYYQQALSLCRAIGDRRGEAVALNSSGASYAELGEKQKALDSFERALPLMRAVGHRLGEAGSFQNLGELRQATMQAATRMPVASAARTVLGARMARPGSLLLFPRASLRIETIS